MDRNADQEERLYHEMRLDTPRARRTRRFAQYILAMMRDFVPSHRDCYRAIEHHLHLVGYEANAEIISVPQECDAMDKLALASLAKLQIAEAAPDMLAALERAEVKLTAYVGICKDDKELTQTIIPMVQAAIAKAKTCPLPAPNSPST